MAKNRNKKKKNSAAMDFSMDTASIPQAMDTSETRAPSSVLGVLDRKIRKGLPTRRSKSLRKKKAIEKATSQMEKLEEKALKNESKTLRTKSAKKLYE
ncbi:uncharacterized protein LOC122660210 [Telopea speciosissima]|uniref:uncharacterized protein LOC122660210 n=1 Tax=Telopea speciosissima TaxID=54955 RepID=UPI001CC586B2|nr:uncharacterized protein LOC122660210 [Telopea speciosissima]